MEMVTMEQGAGTVLQQVLERLLAVVLIVLTLPLLVAVLLTSALTYRAWPIFSHHRLGLANRPFSFPKARTLPPDTDRYVDKYAIDAGTLPWPMAILRRTHLDELPQLLNILRGQLSFVGPRPLVRREVLREGLCAQVLHVGPYAAEKPTIEALHAFIAGQGLAFAGSHHEIYISDPNRTAPAKLKTIVRQPVKKA